MSGKIFVTGTGIISSIGNNKEETATSFISARSGISNITILETRLRDELPAAEIKSATDMLRESAEVSAAKIWSRTALLGLIAAKQALYDAGITDIKQFRTGLISATTVGGMDRSEKFYKEFIVNSSHGRLRDIITHDCADSTELIADTIGIKEYVSTVSTACSSSANSIMAGARLIENGVLDRALVGGTDALTLFTLNGFNSLMIIDGTGCKPFDERRNGLSLGEGAGFLMLESEYCLIRSGKKPLCRITGYGNTCDAYHQTASSPEGTGPFLAMHKAIEKAGIKPEMIDYINAHGTGTKNNDLSEGKAIQRLFKANVPPFSSTKSFTGHTLGAAGAIEAVFCIMSIQNQWILPNLNFSNQMTDLDIAPETDFQTGKRIRHAMSNSFGFGGNNTSLIFSAC